MNWKLQSAVDVLRNAAVDTAFVTLLYVLDRKQTHQQALRKHWNFTPEQSYDMQIIELDVDAFDKIQWFPFSVRGDDAVFGELRGNWDLMTKDFTEQPVYQSLKLRYQQNKPWEATPLYQQAETKIENGKRADNNCKTLADLQDHCRSIDDLYTDMKENGYRSHVDQEWTRTVRGVSVPDEMRVAIDRNGNPIYCASGRHRMAVAKLLGIDTVPGIVQIEHADWDGGYDSRGIIPIQL
ncbi:hypothetical protein K0C01_02935 [Salinarchaeum sp. IM2453]|uniref:hypothetical protein n=1 Tax=Salinarchaeum sp. IM2453 TaxID=2862870 RepID=UPI001C828461|nr:hypothetical protein [Salinarchaeum sp. IM2453]QZA89124.1 hypothetical protein K0C01_02935 [Salinarchaeum sp. IM2453]